MTSEPIVHYDIEIPLYALNSAETHAKELDLLVNYDATQMGVYMSKSRAKEILSILNMLLPEPY